MHIKLLFSLGLFVSELGHGNFPDGRVTSIKELFGESLRVFEILLDDGNDKLEVKNI